MVTCFTSQFCVYYGQKVTSSDSYKSHRQGESNEQKGKEDIEEASQEQSKETGRVLGEDYGIEVQKDLLLEKNKEGLPFLDANNHICVRQNSPLLNFQDFSNKEGREDIFSVMELETRDHDARAFHSTPSSIIDADVDTDSVNICLQESPMKPSRVSTWRRKARGKSTTQNGKSKVSPLGKCNKRSVVISKGIMIHSLVSKRLKAQLTPARSLTQDGLVVATMQSQ